MYKRIVLPLDGSSLSERVLPLAKGLAKALNASIELVLVITEPTDQMPPEISALTKLEGDDYLRRVIESLAIDIDRERLSYVLVRGYPASLILERAELHESTLVLMSSHGYSGVQRLLLGSVAAKVVQAARTPVLLVPANVRSAAGDLVKFERIIAPLDGSKLAESVLPHVHYLCRLLDLELILVRSYDPGFPGSSIRMREVSQIVHDAAENYIKAKVEEMRSEGLTKISYKILRGQPGERIADFAMETPDSLTAMCTHGRHGIGRWMLGSVTDAVIHCAEEPILVIRGCSEAQG